MPEFPCAVRWWVRDITLKQACPMQRYMPYVVQVIQIIWDSQSAL
jgi:hypothetical protein